MLSIRISSKVAKGHVLLPQPVLQSLRLQQHGRVKLQSITTASQIHPRSITLHPVPYQPAADRSTAPADAHGLFEQLSEQHLKELLAAWLAAQASITDNSGQEEQHVPMQQGSVVQLMGDDVDCEQGQAQNMAFQIHMKQPPSLAQAPRTTYALLSAADLAASSSVSVSQGGPVVPSKWVVPEQASQQVQQQQAAMLGSSEAMHAAANSALKHMLPLLAFPCR